MGTHPIFESDFDCLTVCAQIKIVLNHIDKLWLYALRFC